MYAVSFISGFLLFIFVCVGFRFRVGIGWIERGGGEAVLRLFATF